MRKHRHFGLWLLLLAMGCSAGATSPPGEAIPTPTATGTPVPAPIPSAMVATDVIVFAPVGVQGEMVEGYCWTGSVAVWRPSVWRCMAGNRIYDPCFGNEGDQTAVICGATPQNGGMGFKMELTRPLPTPTPSPQALHAWILELDDGTQCGFLQGATRGFGGKRLNYGCSGGWYILGDPQVDQVWTAEEVLLSGDSSSILQSIQVRIRRVWL